MSNDENVDVAALRARNFSQAAAIERLSHGQSVAREERDEALAEAKRVHEELRALIQTRASESRNVATAVAELGANYEKIREALLVTNRKLDTAHHALEGEREAVGRLQAEIDRLRGVGHRGDTYRTVPASVVDDLRAENERLLKRVEAAEQHSEALARSGAAVNGYADGLRTQVAILQRALNALARETSAFRNMVVWAGGRGERPDFTRIDEAISVALAATAGDHAAPEPFLADLAAFFDIKSVWSEQTFGPGDRYAGVVAHIRKELEEILAKPDDLVEWIDVVLLAMDGAWRSAGANGAAFVEALVAKDTKNRARKWPDWRTLAPGEVSEHIREPAK